MTQILDWVVLSEHEYRRQIRSDSSELRLPTTFNSSAPTPINYAFRKITLHTLKPSEESK